MKTYWLMAPVLLWPCLAATAAEAAQGGGGQGDSFSICATGNWKGKGGPVSPDTGGLIDSRDVLAILHKQWPAIPAPKPSWTAADVQAVYAAIQAYGKKTPFTSDIDGNSLGLAYDLFGGQAAIGGGASSFIAQSKLKNTNYLTTDVLMDWAGTSPGIRINCGWKEPPVKKSDDNLSSRLIDSEAILLRDNAADLDQALGHQLNSIFPAPSNSGASLAFHHDELDNTANTFTMHAAVGAAFFPGKFFHPANSDNGNGSAILIFAGASRVNNSSATAKKQNSTDVSSGLGFVVVQQQGKVDWRINGVVEGDTDDRFAASMLYASAQAAVWPANWRCFEGPAQFGNAFKLSCALNLDFDYSNVFNSGDFINLPQKQYARGGFDANATISAPDLSKTYLAQQDPVFRFLFNVVKGLSYSASYKSLQDLTGTGAGLSRFNMAITYALGGGGGDTSSILSGGSASVSLKFVNGRADVTRSAERGWDLSLNIAY